MLDGNFSAQHRLTRNPGDDVALSDGHSFMVTESSYKAHLRTAKKFTEVFKPFIYVKAVKAIKMMSYLGTNLQ